MQLRFDVRRSPSLPEGVRARLMQLAGRRVSGEGVLVINAQTFRTQTQNRRDARERLFDLIRRAALVPKARRPTKPSRRQKKKRLESKKLHGRTKSLRGRVARSRSVVPAKAGTEPQSMRPLPGSACAIGHVDRSEW